MKNYQKWQKNKNYLGSSETICETSINNIWWFIGFTEGNGNFIRSNNRLYFIINQKNPLVLYKIKSILGIGKISKYNNYYRYILTKQEHILFLIYIFNGRLLLNKTNIIFKEWLLLLNIDYIYNDYNSFTLNNAWLSGFIEAEGCFNANIINKDNNSLYICLKFIIDQKNELNILKKIKEKFNCGYIETKNIKYMSRFVLDANKNQCIVIDYLDKFKLKGIKNVNYIKFKRLWNKLNLKQNINIKSIKIERRLINLVKTLNKIDEDRVQN